ncbi:hypothetical protein [Kribbella sindirgiensis]|uniref:Immunity repressor n=1 Tax=Kribbella sindirgiensis TaxID=1124744 RepID=A0A4R0I3A1_9ACTN|nr:hypothetical protein [Kribbella sindirgiensis]TCC19971.1 hypothetical protein E0H50_37745 [Kribbella sindirgiensis]
MAKGRTGTPRTKIQNESEVLRWFEEGRTYKWMVEQYAEKYNIKIGETAFANFRRRHELKPRLAHGGSSLIPWSPVDRRWRWSYPIQMLRLEEKRRRGEALSKLNQEKLDAWLRERKAKDEVVAYLPDRPEEQGFYYVPRRPGIDNDLIREPD